MLRARQLVLMAPVGLILSLITLLSVSVLAGPEGQSLEDKIAPGLVRILEYCEAKQDYDAEIPIIAQVNRDVFDADTARPGLVDHKVLSLVSGFAGKMSVKAIRGLAQSLRIEYLTVDRVVQSAAYLYLATSPIEPLYSSDPFISAIGADQLQDLTPELESLQGSGITVAFLDSGIDLEH